MEGIGTQACRVSEAALSAGAGAGAGAANLMKFINGA